MTNYSEKTVEFLWSLRLNNSREWFQAHKQEYEELMLRPTKELANALFDHLRDKYPKHDWNLHISRIYRDARRLYGRGPMNDHLWFTLWADREEESAPAFWFSFTPEGWDCGMGLWSAGKNLGMERFRAAVRLDPAPAEALAKKLQRQSVFVLGGESYKKPKMETTPLLMPWVNKKWLGLEHRAAHDEISLSDRLFPFVRDGWDWLMPFYEYFLTLPELEEYVPNKP